MNKAFSIDAYTTYEQYDARGNNLVIIPFDSVTDTDIYTVTSGIENSGGIIIYGGQLRTVRRMDSRLDEYRNLYDIVLKLEDK